MRADAADVIDLTPEQLMLRDVLRDFAQGKVAPEPGTWTGNVAFRERRGRKGPS